MRERAKADEVLAVYRQISPSALGIEDPTVHAQIERRLKQVLWGRLKLPPRFFRGLRYLNLGCGSGEQDVIMAGWGASGIGLDFNPDSIARARGLAERFKLQDRLTFEVQDVLSPRWLGEPFDLVISDGVLPHVEKPRLLLEQMARHVAPEGMLVLGYLDLAGNLQRLLHGLIARRVAAETSAADLEQVARQLFPEHLERCQRFGGRSVRAVINDYISNEHSYGVDTIEIVDLMRQLGCELFTAYPLVPTAVNTTPADQYNHEKVVSRRFWRLQQFAWMFARDYDEWTADSAALAPLLERLDTLILDQNSEDGEDVIQACRDFVAAQPEAQLSAFVADVSTGLDELQQVIRALRSTEPLAATVNGDAYARLFRGFNGFGTCYLSFLKATEL